MCRAAPGSRSAGTRSLTGAVMTVHIGTSGWSYDHWVGPFYAPGLPSDQRLAQYARSFDTTEINNSFYHLPAQETLRGWREAVSTDFLFAVKASRYITHMKKLKDPEQGVSQLLERMGRLDDQLGPFLFQLPPRWRFNAERLERFLASLSRDFRYAFELRDRSWLNDRAIELLTRFGAALCIYELDGFVSPREVTTDFVYIRLHGPNGPYRGDYSKEDLSAWGQAIRDWSGQGLDVYLYFDNDEAGYAARNALQLRERLEQARREGSPPRNG